MRKDGSSSNCSLVDYEIEKLEPVCLEVAAGFFAIRLRGVNYDTKY